MKQTKDVAVLAAEIAVNGAKRRVEQLQIELKAAQDELGKAYGALKDARLAADKKLSSVKMETCHWSGKTEITEMVVDSCTPKSITVRYPGLDSGFTFRVDARGKWRQYPRPKGFCDLHRTLVGL